MGAAVKPPAIAGITQDASCRASRGELRSHLGDGPSHGCAIAEFGSTFERTKHREELHDLPVCKLEGAHDGALRLLRFPGRALDSPADREPDRVVVRNRAPSPARHEGCWLTGEGLAHGFQAAGDVAATLAPSERSAPRRSSASRSEVRGRSAKGTRRPTQGEARRLTDAFIHNI